MIKLLNAGVTILFYLLFLTGIVYMYNKLSDLFNVHTDLPEPEQGKTLKTTYPDEMPPNFNDWANYIHKQLN